MADRLGGDCTWTGCVPSKTLLKVARVAQEMRTVHKHGLTSTEPVVDLGQVMGHVRSVIDEVYQEENPEALRASGVEVLLWEARFTDPHTLSVGDSVISAQKVRSGHQHHARAEPRRSICVHRPAPQHRHLEGCGGAGRIRVCGYPAELGHQCQRHIRRRRLPGRQHQAGGQRRGRGSDGGSYGPGIPGTGRAHIPGSYRVGGRSLKLAYPSS